jgi:hypothetical protein
MTKKAQQETAQARTLAALAKLGTDGTCTLICSKGHHTRAALAYVRPGSNALECRRCLKEKKRRQYARRRAWHLALGGTIRSYTRKPKSNP